MFVTFFPNYTASTETLLMTKRNHRRSLLIFTCCFIYSAGIEHILYGVSVLL